MLRRVGSVVRQLWWLRAALCGAAWEFVATVSNYQTVAWLAEKATAVFGIPIKTAFINGLGVLTAFGWFLWDVWRNYQGWSPFSEGIRPVATPSQLKVSRPSLEHQFEIFCREGNGVVIGSPGIGKTRLLDAWVEAAKAEGRATFFLPFDAIGATNDADLAKELRLPRDLIEDLQLRAAATDEVDPVV